MCIFTDTVKVIKFKRNFIPVCVYLDKEGGPRACYAAVSVDIGINFTEEPMITTMDYLHYKFR